MSRRCHEHSSMKLETLFLQEKKQLLRQVTNPSVQVFQLTSTCKNICIKQFLSRFFHGGRGYAPKLKAKVAQAEHTIPHNAEISHGHIKEYQWNKCVHSNKKSNGDNEEKCSLCVSQILRTLQKMTSSLAEAAFVPYISPEKPYWGVANYVSFNTFNFKKIVHTASCSSSSASAANSPFLIPSEFLLVSSSDRGNWYRVLRALIRTCGNSRILMLINIKWKNSKFCTLRTNGRPVPGINLLVSIKAQQLIDLQFCFRFWQICR